MCENINIPRLLLPTPIMIAFTQALHTFSANAWYCSAPLCIRDLSTQIFVSTEILEPAFLRIWRDSSAECIPLSPVFWFIVAVFEIEEY